MRLRYAKTVTIIIKNKMLKSAKKIRLTPLFTS